MPHRWTTHGVNIDHERCACEEEDNGIARFFLFVCSIPSPPIHPSPPCSTTGRMVKTGYWQTPHRIMKLIIFILAASIMTAPVQSSSLRSLVGDKPSSNKSGEESETAITIINGESDQGERKLLSSWCADDTPTLWHPDYDTAWSAAGCILTADCDSPGYNTEQECCKGSYGGQTSGACSGETPPQLSGTPNMARRGPMPVARVTGHIRTMPLFSSTVSLSAARVPLADRPAARALAGSPTLPPWPQSP